MNFDKNEFREFLESIRLVYGYDFTEYSEASVKRRVANFMNNRKISALDKLAKLILQDERIFENFKQRR